MVLFRIRFVGHVAAGGSTNMLFWLPNPIIPLGLVGYDWVTFWVDAQCAGLLAAQSIHISYFEEHRREALSRIQRYGAWALLSPGYPLWVIPSV